MNLLRKSSMILLGTVAAGLFAFACAENDGGVTGDAAEVNAEAPVKRADTLVISTVYGGGGNGGASDANGDYVELFNPTAEKIDLAAYALQTQPKGKTAFSKTHFSKLKGTVEPGHYFLIGLAKESKPYGPDGKKPDLFLTGHETDLIAGAGAVAIVKADKLCDDDKCDGEPGDLVDLVGYGSFDGDIVALHTGENGAAAKPKNKTEAVTRIKSGCVDSSDNKADFESLPLSPRTSADSADCDKILAPVVPVQPDSGPDSATPDGGDGGDGGDGATEPTQPTEPTTPDAGPDSSTKPPTTGPTDGEDGEEEPAAPAPTTGKKKKSASANAPPQPIAASSPSCSTSSGPVSGGYAGLVGIGLALTALGRRRKK